jgi:aminopeptidase N
MKRLVRAVFLAVLALGASTAPASASGVIGAPGVGDPFFPLAGNGGIDVQDYSLRLAYDPATRRLDGIARLSIVATQDLRRFDLDLRAFDLGPVSVNGRRAGVLRDGQELMITPRRPIRRGEAFSVVVPYSGVPETIVDPDTSVEGFVPTADGAVVVGEPQGSPGWYPVNDTPRDKATYTIQMTVPDGLTAVGNGALEGHFSHDGRTTFRWRERYPMAPYLATITLGRFHVDTGRTQSGVPTYVAVDPTQAADADPTLKQLPDMVYFLERL